MTANRDEQVRKQALHILFAALHRDGRSDIWLAQQLGINKSRLWNYKSGKNRAPEWLVEQAAQIVNEPIERVYRIAPRAVLLQRQGEWRGRKPASRKVANNAVSPQHNTSDQPSASSSRRRRQSPQPAQRESQRAASPAAHPPTTRRRARSGNGASAASATGAAPASTY